MVDEILVGISRVKLGFIESNRVFFGGLDLDWNFRASPGFTEFYRVYFSVDQVLLSYTEFLLVVPRLFGFGTGSNWVLPSFFFGRSVLFWIYWTFTEFYRVLPSLYLKFTLFSLVFIGFWSWLLYRVGTGSQLGFTGFFSYVSYVR